MQILPSQRNSYVFTLNFSVQYYFKYPIPFTKRQRFKILILFQQIANKINRSYPYISWLLAWLLVMNKVTLQMFYNTQMNKIVGSLNSPDEQSHTLTFFGKKLEWKNTIRHSAEYFVLVDIEIKVSISNTINTMVVFMYPSKGESVPMLK